MDIMTEACTVYGDHRIKQQQQPTEKKWSRVSACSADHKIVTPLLRLKVQHKHISLIVLGHDYLPDFSQWKRVVMKQAESLNVLVWLSVVTDI